MKEYKFWIRRTHGGPYEMVSITAENSNAAVNALPPCVDWNFKTPACSV
jgi:hypothetical protein